MALIDDFKARFPEFDAEQVDELLPTFEGVWQCYYGGNYKGCEKEIILMLLAHMFVEASSGDVQGTKEVASQTVGNVSETFAGGGTGSSMNRLWPYFGSTKYGKLFMLLVNRNTGARFV
jgi:hypothetical protein